MGSLKSAALLVCLLACPRAFALGVSEPELARVEYREADSCRDRVDAGHTRFTAALRSLSAEGEWLTIAVDVTPELCAAEGASFRWVPRLPLDVVERLNEAGNPTRVTHRSPELNLGNANFGMVRLTPLANLASQCVTYRVRADELLNLEERSDLANGIPVRARATLQYRSIVTENSGWGDSSPVFEPGGVYTLSFLLLR